MEWRVEVEEWKWEEVEDGEEERRGMEGEGSGLFMDDTDGGWVRVHKEVARLGHCNNLGRGVTAM